MRGNPYLAASSGFIPRNPFSSPPSSSWEERLGPRDDSECSTAESNCVNSLENFGVRHSRNMERDPQRPRLLRSWSYQCSLTHVTDSARPLKAAEPLLSNASFGLKAFSKWATNKKYVSNTILRSPSRFLKSSSWMDYAIGQKCIPSCLWSERASYTFQEPQKPLWHHKNKVHLLDEYISDQRFPDVSIFVTGVCECW